MKFVHFFRIHNLKIQRILKIKNKIINKLKNKVNKNIAIPLSHAKRNLNSTDTKQLYVIFDTALGECFFTKNNNSKEFYQRFTNLNKKCIIFLQ